MCVAGMWLSLLLLCLFALHGCEVWPWWAGLAALRACVYLIEVHLRAEGVVGCEHHAVRVRVTISVAVEHPLFSTGVNATERAAAAADREAQGPRLPRGPWRGRQGRHAAVVDIPPQLNEEERLARLALRRSVRRSKYARIARRDVPFPAIFDHALAAGIHLRAEVGQRASRVEAVGLDGARACEDNLPRRTGVKVGLASKLDRGRRDFARLLVDGRKTRWDEHPFCLLGAPLECVALRRTCQADQHPRLVPAPSELPADAAGRCRMRRNHQDVRFGCDHVISLLGEVLLVAKICEATRAHPCGVRAVRRVCSRIAVARIRTSAETDSCARLPIRIAKHLEPHLFAMGRMTARPVPNEWAFDPSTAMNTVIHDSLVRHLSECPVGASRESRPDRRVGEERKLQAARRRRREPIGCVAHGVTCRGVGRTQPACGDIPATTRDASVDWTVDAVLELPEERLRRPRAGRANRHQVRPGNELLFDHPLGLWKTARGIERCDAEEAPLSVREHHTTLLIDLSFGCLHHTTSVWAKGRQRSAKVAEVRHLNGAHRS
eukprot:5412177-Prymnesium_polylepis.1